MKVKDSEISIACEIGACMNLADFAIDTNGAACCQVFLCKQCAQDVFEALGERLVPKSPKSMFLKEQEPICEAVPQPPKCECDKVAKKAAAVSKVKRKVIKKTKSLVGGSKSEKTKRKN